MKPWVLGYPWSAQQGLIGLHQCTGSPVSSLGTHAILLVLLCISYCNDPKFSDSQFWTKSVDPDPSLHCLPFLLQLLDVYLYELLTTKPTNWPLLPTKMQISLGICPVWSESSLSVWRNTGSSAIQWAQCKDSDQTEPFCWFCHEAAHYMKKNTVWILGWLQQCFGVLRYSLQLSLSSDDVSLTEHQLHHVMPGCFWYWPGGQGRQLLSFQAKYWPGTQSER